MYNKLRKIRMKQGLSVTELARRSNTSRQTITKIELHGQEPSGLTMILIARALEIDPREIFLPKL